jgi:hypothetical protein
MAINPRVSEAFDASDDQGVASLLDRLQAAIEAQKASSLAGDDDGVRRHAAVVGETLTRLEAHQAALAAGAAKRLLQIRDAHRAVCLALAQERQEVRLRLDRLARGKSAAQAYGR